MSEYDLESLRGLEKRLAEASGADRELDCAIHVTLFRWKLARVGVDVAGENDCEVWTETGKLIKGFGYPPKGSIAPFYHVPDVRYTASLDAAIALAERVMKAHPHGPLWTRRHDVRYDSNANDKWYFAEITVPSREYQGAHRSSEAIALCLAIVRALIAKAKPHE